MRGCVGGKAKEGKGQLVREFSLGYRHGLMFEGENGKYERRYEKYLPNILGRKTNKIFAMV